MCLVKSVPSVRQGDKPKGVKPGSDGKTFEQFSGKSASRLPEYTSPV